MTTLQEEEKEGRRRDDADVFMATLRCMTDGMSAEILVEFHFLRPHRT